LTRRRFLKALKGRRLKAAEAQECKGAFEKEDPGNRRPKTWKRKKLKAVTELHA